MDKKIDGKQYKEMKVNKIVINGKEKDGSVIDVEDIKNNSGATVTIIVGNMDKDNNDKK